VTAPAAQVLYVDSDDEALLVLPQFLARVGEVRSAKTLAAARAALAEATPQLLVIDPALPDGDGIELVVEVRARYPWLQIFVITGSGFADRTAELIAAGANDVAVKPFDVGKLPGRAGALLRAAESARKEIEYRHSLETRLLHAERIATLGTLCATVAHEIANPLTLISANVDVVGQALRAGEPIDEPGRSALRDAVSEVRLAAGMIQAFVQRIRMFSRREERRRVTASLAPIVDTALLLLKPRLPAHRIVVHRPEGRAPAVPHYPIRLTQALLNLLTNAIESVGSSGDIHLRYIDEPDAAGIEVRDDGPGLSDEVRRRVFEPFFTSKADGTGLGLVLVRAIMSEHDGQFELTPGPDGRGASARLLLPRVIDERPSNPG
jgi:C4-dicarboxylate-specific signal transduction histidine kinase